MRHRVKYEPARRLKPLNATKSAYVNYDEDGDISMTSDTYIEDQRQPILTPTGVLDASGDMIIRVAMPIREKVGFAIPNPKNPPDMVEYLAPAESLTIVEENMGGVSSVTEAEALEIDPHLYGEEGDGGIPSHIGGLSVIGTSDSGMPVIRLSDLIRKLTTEGIAVAIDIDLDQGGDSE